MVQDQLVEYISSQTKAGVSRDAVKSALVGVGWAAADVEDTLKKIEAGNKPVSPAVGGPTTSVPIGAVSKSSGPAGMASTPTSASAQKGPSLQSVRMSDLVSGSAPASFPAKSVSGEKTKPIDLATGVRMNEKAAKGGSRVTMMAGAAAIVVLAGLAGFFYFQNNSLSGQITSLSGTSTDVTSRLTALNSQVQALNASNTALAAEVAALTAQNTDLATNLLFLAIPTASSTASASGTVSVSGTLTGGKSSYALTTAYGVVIYVANVKNASTTAVLKPLLGSTSSVMLTGTHAAGSPYLTVTAVNGAPIQ